MSDAIDLFEPEGFIPNDMRPSNVTFRSRKTKRVKPCFQKYPKQANKRLASTDPEPKLLNSKIMLAQIQTACQRDSVMEIKRDPRACQ